VGGLSGKGRLSTFDQRAHIRCGEAVGEHDHESLKRPRGLVDQSAANVAVPAGPARQPLQQLLLDRPVQPLDLSLLPRRVRVCPLRDASERERCLPDRIGRELKRTVDALQALDASLANTGQTLTRLGHHTYTLAPRPELLHAREIGRCLRHTSGPLDLAAAIVLHGALTCPREDRARGALSNPAERAAANRLIAARLLEDDHGFLRVTPLTEATFRAAPHRRELRWTA
jgi:hypothetical protein